MLGSLDRLLGGDEPVGDLAGAAARSSTHSMIGHAACASA
jgi:hypothetical protein